MGGSTVKKRGFAPAARKTGPDGAFGEAEHEASCACVPAFAVAFENKGMRFTGA